MAKAIAAFLLLFIQSSAWATPPLNAVLTYDQEKGLLHVEAAHPSDKPEKHFIRRVTVAVKDNSQEFIFVRQRMAGGFQEDLEFQAKPGDKIEVKFFCSQGGTTTAELDIPKEEEEKPLGEKEKPKEVIWEDVI